MKTKNKLIRRTIGFILVGVGVTLLVYAKKIMLGCFFVTIGYFLFLKDD